MKVCFLTSSIYNDKSKIDIPNKFDRFGNYDFFLFTNLDKSNFNNTSWDIINISDEYLNSKININNFRSKNICNNNIKSKGKWFNSTTTPSKTKYL